jgi:hypothetical protein
MTMPMNPDDRRTYRQPEEVAYNPPPQNVPRPPPSYNNSAPVSEEQRTYSEAMGVQVERNHHDYYDANGDLVQREEEIRDDPYNRRLDILDRISLVLYFVLGALEILLVLRLVFRLLDAATDNGFISFLYNLSGVFVAPFNGIFNDQTLGRGNVLEFSTLLAMGIYALLFFGLVQLLYLLFKPLRQSRQVSSTTNRRQF